MTTLRYQITIKDNGSADKNIEIVFTDLNGRHGTRATTDALIPALDQLTRALCEDVEAAF